jgi:glycyl-tRNA synthetase beta chain
MNTTTLLPKTLLIELGTEELPPKSLKKLGLAFAKSVFDALSETQLVTSDSKYQWFAAPRRLAVSIPNIASKQPDQSVERRGPAVQAAFKEDGSATPAALGFAKSCGVEIDQLDRVKTDKGEWLYFKQQVEGKKADELIQSAIETAIKQLPIAKRMRWGNRDVEFVRPVHWLVALHGNTVIPAKTLDLDASNTSSGHRFHSDVALIIDNADKYREILEDKGYVIADFSQRQNMIKEQITSLAESISGEIENDQDLLDEVTGLVEYPHAILGSIDSRFMSVPQESLISSMRDHQKYFHIVDANGKLMPYFITVSNIDSKDVERVRSGNERVLRARLSDAEFFWNTDQKIKLEDRLRPLENVLYHIKLGSVADKAKRMESLSGDIASLIGANNTIAARGGLLAKADLVSSMVGEFSDLQGIMGRYYADKDGEDKIVGECIEQHYWPKFAGDQLPHSAEAQAVSLAEKLDSLVGIYGVGEVPTGDKDPYALRRAALGILRILIEKKHAIGLPELIHSATSAYAKQGIEIDKESQIKIISFIQERFKAFYQTEGIATKLINAVLACQPEKPIDFDARLRALQNFAELPEASELAAANKRISNILKKANSEDLTSVDSSLFSDEAELSLAKAIDSVAQKSHVLFEQGDYTEGLKLLATLRDSVDGFFDNVMVMTDDIRVKNNRLSLLKQLQGLFLRVADISII